jgi:predicted metal-dependent HD superfamily phosphohydrolase
MKNPFKTFEESLKTHISEKTIKELSHLWNEKTRYYHNVNHLIQILEDIEKHIDFRYLYAHEKQALLLAAFFHDAIYNPKRNDNEDQSIKYFKASYIGKFKVILETVCDLIETTKYRNRPTIKLQRIFWEADNAKFKAGYKELLNNEKMLQKEYSFIDKKKYKEKRIKFLESNIGLFGPSTDKDINKLIEYIKKVY